MKRKQQAQQPSGFTPENVAWKSLLLVPALVSVSVGMVPFWLGSRFSFGMYVYPRLFMLAVLVAVSMVAWATGVMSGSIAVRSVPLRWPLLAFIGLSLLSTAFALSPSMSFFGGRYLSVGLFVFLLVAAMFLLVTQLVTSMDRVYAISWSTVAGGLGIAVIGLFQIAGIDPIGIASTENAWLAQRGASLLGNSDFTGAALVVPAVVALALGLSERSLGRRVTGLVSFGVILAALVGTLTRGAWIGVFVGVAVLLVASVRSSSRPTRQQYGILAAVFAFPLLVIAFNWTLVTERFRDLASASTAGGGRLVLWQEALAVIARHPLLGVGPDAYRLGWYGVRGAESVRLTGIAIQNEDPHNMILLFGATLGIPALIAAVWFVISALTGSYKAAFARDAGEGRRILTGWWAALLAMCVVMLVAPNSILVMLMVFLSAGMLAAPRATRAEVSPVLTRAITWGGIAFSVAVLVIAGLTMVADVRVMQAQSSPRKSAALAQAAAIAPWYIEAQDQTAAEYSELALGALEAKQPIAAEAARAAEQRLLALVKMNPHEYRSWAMLAVFYNNAGPAYREDALQRGAQAASEGIRVYPINVEASTLKAFALESQGDHEGAVEALKSNWNLDPRYFDAGKTYLVALVGAGQIDEARAVLSDLEMRFPENPEVAQLAAFVESQTQK